MSSKDVLDSRSLRSFLSSMSNVLKEDDKLEVVVRSKDIQACPEIAMEHNFAIIDGEEDGEDKIKLVLVYKGKP